MEGEIELSRQHAAFERSSRGWPIDPIETALQATICEATVFIAYAKRVRNTRAQRRNAALGKAGIKMIADAFTVARLSDDLRGAAEQCAQAPRGTQQSTPRR